MPDGSKVTQIRPGIENEHGPLVFQVRLFADGHLDWTSPQTPDPAMNEIVFRGYFDKLREAILQHMSLTNGTRIIT